MVVNDKRRPGRSGTACVSLLVAVVAGLLSACTIDASATSEPAPVIETPSPNESDAVRFRKEVGLRSDVAWVRSVAANPAASSVEFAIPMMPEEIAELNARGANADAVVGIVQAYAAEHADEFGGLYLDQAQGGGAVTSLWTAHLDQHAAAILTLVRPGARIAFRPARFTEAELNALQGRISTDWEWMRVVDIAWVGSGVDVIGNRVEIYLSSTRPDAAAIVAAHYAVPPGMLSVISDGTGAALIPRGTVRGRVLDQALQPPGAAFAGELILQWTSDGPGDCGGPGDIGFGVEPDGTFQVPCQAGGHTIMIQIGVPGVGWQTIASGHVVAVGDATVGLEIRLDGLWRDVVAP